MRRSRTAVVLGTLFLALALVAGCTSEAPGGGGGSTGGDEPPKAKVVATPAVDAKEVPPTEPVTVSVTEGTLDEVELTNEGGKPVAGELAADKLSWKSSEVLGYAKKYTYTASATGTDGKKVELKGTFTTLKPAKTPRATVNPGDNATVGVAMPISIKFPEGKVTDKAAVEKALKVETSQPVEGSWAWLHDQQVDWRPKEYWPAGTKVTVTAKLYGLAYGGGAYGKADLSSKFTIGRNQVVKINTPDHKMNVYRDGKLFASYPASNGKDADPNLNTPNGTMIVMQKDPIGDFSNPRYGYTNVKKKWAVRFSNHGEFIHENEENRANIGKVNSSHGCVNLFEADAKAYFDSAIIGDPVEVTGSQANMPTTSDVYDWLIPWGQWQQMSALR
ncbi:Lipoprotein-anchoring transpeptidase ErfK/SrfK [Actinokineospora alba]|uniref:Lipoprotein-anchoring transpeptidase ErfK/SrfK n=1 Tax=Actinokineospora alba TaxID=504798 RepID=A0A1H0PBH9_9PSEU|nr:lipoprotein-anchoring transpeptidase ErfK/SrfK [Actinokineospora alba]SDI66871.1 Lipoprotein-anchoring transpeptidase ErfK/SrfK [Actinokineospora alba]SDP02055.1 Lipoprotein-anchoring transpeptidase ErfK/SrfK [Actinokineospora alba]